MFGINGTSITDQHLESMKSQILNQFDDLLCLGFLITLNLMTPNKEFIPHLFQFIPVFGIPSIPNTEQYLGSMESQKLTYHGDMLCVVFPYTPNPTTTIFVFFRGYASKFSIWD